LRLLTGGLPVYLHDVRWDLVITHALDTGTAPPQRGVYRATSTIAYPAVFVSVNAEQEKLNLRLRLLTPPALLTPPVRGHASRLVHRQRRGDEQHQQRGAGVGHELDL
jgi:hypothetical protein